jgi:hypothetical protein
LAVGFRDLSLCITLISAPVAIGCALLYAPWLKSFSDVGDNGEIVSHWKPRGSRLGLLLVYPLTVIYIVANLFVFIVSWFPADLQKPLYTNSPIITSYAGPTATVIIYAIGALYWGWDLHILRALGYDFKKLQEDVKVDGSGDIELKFDVSGLPVYAEESADRESLAGL